MNRSEFFQIIRGLAKRKAISVINIAGLAIGFTFVILAGLYAYSEVNFDRFHENHEKIYRVEWNTPDLKANATSGNTSSWLKDNIPEIKYSTRILKDEIMGMVRNVVYNRTRYDIKNPLVVDNDFFNMFSFRLLQGEISSFENNKYSVALTETVSKKIFGKEDPIGKTITYKDEIFTVRAVFEDPPINSSIRFEMLLPSANMPSYVTMNWLNSNVHTFIQSDNIISHDQLQQKIHDGIISEFNSLGYTNQANTWHYLLNPLDDIYYSSYSSDAICVHGSKTITLLLINLAILVLVIAILNYTNSVFANASESMKEIGIRSVNGSSRTNNIRFLVYQAVFPSLIAVLFALLISQPVKNILGNLLNIALPGLTVTQSIIILLAGILTGIIIGIYPALKLSSSKITDSLRGSEDSGVKTHNFRNIVSIAQFAASIALLISVFTIYKQINFVLKQSGKNINDEVVLNMPMANRGQQTPARVVTIIETLKTLPEIAAVSTSLHTPGDASYSRMGLQFINNGEMSNIAASHNMVGADYPEVMGYKIIEGRTFNRNLKSDYLSYIVNEAFIEENGIQDISEARINGYPIIGVVEDFYYNSLHQEIQPLAIHYEESYQSRIVVKLAPVSGSLSETVKKINGVINGIDDTAISDVIFLDQYIAKLYEKEIQFSNILVVLALFSILISCMGLFSMSLFITRLRTKEIGIRKVNGAKVSEILAMLNKDFVKWVVIAFVLATPFAYYIMDKWLENYAYKTNLSWWVFALAGALALGIALLTVSWQSWRAATRNPVEALRYE